MWCTRYVAGNLEPYQFKPNQKSFYYLLELSSTLHHLRQIHALLFHFSFHQDHFLITKFIKICQHFEQIGYARSIYAQTHNPSIYVINSMIQAFEEAHHQNEAVRLYTQILNQKAKPNNFTFPPLLKACNNLREINLVKGVHTHVIKFGSCRDVYVGTTLVDVYSRCGKIDCARQVFDEMPVRNVVSWNSMVSSLAKSGDVEAARKLFALMPERNVVSWTSLISGYTQNGYFYETLKLFEDMDLAGVKPTDVTLVSVLSACANLGGLNLGRKIHCYLNENGFGLDIFVGTALIDLYSKCGMISDALQVFERIPERNVVSCSAMILGLAMNGRGMEALGVFKQMLMEGTLPNDITFVGVLCACCHVGLVDKGRYYFNSMSQEFSIVPKLQHYACMVDLLGRAGHLEEALEFIKRMPVEPDVVVWGALLGACWIHRDLKLGEYVAKRVLELDPRHSGGFVFLSNVYAKSGNWDAVTKLRSDMENVGMKKIPGKSWIEVNNIVYQFFMGDRSHPQSDRIYTMLDELAKKLELEGYLANVDLVLHDIEEEEKEQSLFFHSEKIAIAFGLIKTAPGTCIRIVKNLRVCIDCHSYIELVTKVVKREIILRDSNRFHHFAGGICSCKGYW